MFEHVALPSSLHLTSLDRTVEMFLNQVMLHAYAVAEGCTNTAIAGTAIPEEVERLGELLRLSEDERWILALALAPRLSTEIALVFGKLRGLSRRSPLTLEILAALEGVSLFEVQCRYPWLETGRGLLRRMGLVHQRGEEIDVSQATLGWILGARELDGSLANVASFLESEPVELVLREGTRQTYERIRSLWSFGAECAPLTCIHGHAGTGRSTIARHLAQASSRRAIEIKTSEVPSSVDVLELVREAKWHGAVLVFQCDPGLSGPWVSRIEECITHEVPIVLLLPAGARPLCSSLRMTVSLDLAAPGIRERAALWAQFLPARVREHGLSDEELAFRFRGHGRSIYELARSALDQLNVWSEHRGRVTRELLEDTAHRLLTAELSGLGVWCAPLSRGLSSLVLEPRLQEQVEGVLARVRHRHTVLASWGFSEAAYGLGTVVLLSGPPGTGKTLCARAVCTELKVPLYRVDLSQIVSKWVGETEKHLEAVFSEAEACGAALLFDEADALFSKRSEVKGSNDHFANLQVGFLLQRIESFDGLCFLTTNMSRSIDAAFVRRMSFHLKFDLPEVEQRQRIWESIFPGDAPVDPSVDTQKLAKDYPEMSGGDIRSSVLAAAFAAAESGSPITHKMLERAAIKTLQASGALVRDLDET